MEERQSVPLAQVINAVLWFTNQGLRVFHDILKRLRRDDKTALSWGWLYGVQYYGFEISVSPLDLGVHFLIPCAGGSHSHTHAHFPSRIQTGAGWCRRQHGARKPLRKVIISDTGTETCNLWTKKRSFLASGTFSRKLSSGSGLTERWVDWKSQHLRLSSDPVGRVPVGSASLKGLRWWTHWGGGRWGGGIEPQWRLHSKEISRRGKLNARWWCEVSSEENECGERVKFISDLANDVKKVPSHCFSFSNITSHNWSFFCTHVRKPL